jgi:hypothetical protein
MQAFLGIAIAAFFAWGVIDALRTGRARGVTRKKNPIFFWVSITLGTLVAFAVLAAGFGLLPGQMTR